MGSSAIRRRRRRVTFTSAAVLTVVAVVSVWRGVSEPASRAPMTVSPARTPVTSPSAVVFGDRLIVEGLGAFTAAEVARLGRAVPEPPVPVTVTELLVTPRSGDGQVPLATMIVDGARYASAAAEPTLAAELSRGAVVSRSAARMLGVVAGDSLRPASGGSLAISAVVDDALLGGHEVLLGRTAEGTSPLGLADDVDYVIVRATATARADTESAIRAALPDRRLRFTVPQLDAYFSPSATVLSQSQVQARFGMLRLRQDGNGFTVDPAWVAANIAERSVPLLGRVTCNAKVLPALGAAMAELARRGLSDLVETADFARQGGCWSVRTVRDGSAVSRHTWGIAVDINVAHNPLGATPRQDPRLVAVMERNGFTWGGRWLRPDGAHFEWVGTTTKPLARPA
ncbi:MAG: M15 family metallopeptidase [Actinobacteria bacterium]|nr:M15 family metallopeptidase [Actinomycetota bacterium]